MVISRIIERILFFILENLVVIGTICFSLFLVLKSQTLKLSDSQLLIWIISLLGLLATSMFLEKVGKLRRIEVLSKMSYDFLINHQNKSSFDTFFKRRRTQPSIEDRLDGSREIFITGGSLNRITNEYLGYFESKASENSKLKFLLVNPDSNAAELLVDNVVYEVQSHDAYANQTRSSLNTLINLRNLFPNQVDVRITNQVPPFGLILTDPNKDSGAVTVEIFGYALPARERASFLIHKNREPEAYDYFKKQFESIWNSSINAG